MRSYEIAGYEIDWDRQVVVVRGLASDDTRVFISFRMAEARKVRDTWGEMEL